MTRDRTGIWGIHSERDNKPMFRAWAKSKSEAEQLLVDIKASDREPEDEYWIMEMTDAEAESCRECGIVPEGI